MPKIELEYEEKHIPLDANLPEVMKKLAEEGWTIAPGKVPMGVYPLVRNPDVAGRDHVGHINAKLVIDDSKVIHIPAGSKPQ